MMRGQTSPTGVLGSRNTKLPPASTGVQKMSSRPPGGSSWQRNVETVIAAVHGTHAMCLREAFYVPCLIHSLKRVQFLQKRKTKVPQTNPPLPPSYRSRDTCRCLSYPQKAQWSHTRCLPFRPPFTKFLENLKKRHECSFRNELSDLINNAQGTKAGKGNTPQRLTPWKHTNKSQIMRRNELAALRTQKQESHQPGLQPSSVGAGAVAGGGGGRRGGRGGGGRGGGRGRGGGGEREKENEKETLRRREKGRDRRALGG